MMVGMALMERISKAKLEFWYWQVIHPTTFENLGCPKYIHLATTKVEQTLFSPYIDEKRGVLYFPTISWLKEYILKCSWYNWYIFSMVWTKSSVNIASNAREENVSMCVHKHFKVIFSFSLNKCLTFSEIEIILAYKAYSWRKKLPSFQWNISPLCNIYSHHISHFGHFDK